jgi:ParB family chromosome partitioning protein
MPSDIQPAEVPLSAIDSENETFRITTNLEVGDLVSAFERVGLSNPPILKPQNDKYHLVCGFRRVSAARLVGWQSIPARILPDNVDPLSCALLAISENSIERSLNLIETSRALSLLASLSENMEAMAATARRIGLPGNRSHFQKIIPLCQLPKPLQTGLLSGALALPSVHLLSNLPSETAVPLSQFLADLKLSLHKQRELIDIVLEISKLEDLSVETVISSAEITDILEDPKADLPQKSGRIRRCLKQRRFPNLSQAQEEFDHLKSQLKLGENVSLKAPPGFESNRYTLSLTFGSPAELQSQMKVLGELSAHPEFNHLLTSRDPHQR